MSAAAAYIVDSKPAAYRSCAKKAPDNAKKFNHRHAGRPGQSASGKHSRQRSSGLYEYNKFIRGCRHPLNCPLSVPIPQFISRAEPPNHTASA